MSISNLGHDERWAYRGGSAGDNNGTEWQIVNWYSYPDGWNCVLRYPDAKIRNWMGNQARAAANNNHIGYDQGQRQTFWEQLQKVGYDASKITVNCESDCSAGVLAIAKAAGFHFDVQKLKEINQNGYTGNEEQILRDAGFQVLRDSKYLTSDKYLDNGDILLNTQNHTAFNITRGTNCDADSVVVPATKSIAIDVSEHNGRFDGKPEPTPEPKPVKQVPTISYEIKNIYGITASGKDGSEVTLPNAIVGIKIGVSVGKIQYRVHCDGRWLPKVSGNNWGDYNNGYAGDDTNAIDALQIYYTSDTGKTELYEAVYAVKPFGLGWLSEVHDTNWENGDGDNTAGMFGFNIGAVKISLKRC